MGSLKHDELKRLVLAFQAAFATEDDLDDLTRLEMNTPLQDITPTETMPEMIKRIIVWAEAKGRTEELIRKAISKVPGNKELQRCASDILRRLGRPQTLAPTMMRYHDFTLTITASWIRVSSKICDEGKGEASARFSVDPVALLCVQRLHYWLNHSLERFPSITEQDQPCKLADLKAIGLLLHRILFSEKKIRDVFDKAYKDFDEAYGPEKAKLIARGQNQEIPKLRFRLQLILDNDADKDLTTLPWEFLFVPPKGDAAKGFFFSGERTELILTRYSPDKSLEESLKPHPGELRILVVGTWAEPVELNTVRAEIDNLQHLDHIQTWLLRDPKDKDEVKNLIGHFEPHIVHYIGHGEPDGLALSANAKISREDFKGLFSQQRPRLVFLQSRKDATNQSLQSLNSTARDLVDAKIPAVIAMQYSISDNDAGTFAQEFYRQLGLGQNIDEAVKAGRVALGSRPPKWEHPRFGTPRALFVVPKCNCSAAFQGKAVRRRPDGKGATHSRWRRRSGGGLVASSEGSLVDRRAGAPRRT